MNQNGLYDTHKHIQNNMLNRIAKESFFLSTSLFDKRTRESMFKLFLFSSSFFSFFLFKKPHRFRVRRVYVCGLGQ